jgi:flagellar hook-associated protein FlgK
MSDRLVRVAIEQMEAWIADPAWEPDPDRLAQWNAEFTAAMAGAEKAEGWPQLLARAHALGAQLEDRVIRLAQLRDDVRAELDALECGTRALRGYGASTR